MDTRDNGGVRLGADRPVVVQADDVSAVADRPVVLGGPPERGGSRPRGRRRVLVLGLVAGLALVVAVAAWVAGRGDGEVATTPAPGAEPTGPAPLTLQVEVVAPVVAGRPATVLVRYDDGDGIFSGATEEWGDGVGAGSVKQGRCEAAGAPQPAQPAAGSYQATHVWTEPGSYPVKVAVTTYTCVDGAAVREEAVRTLTVVVAGR